MSMDNRESSLDPDAIAAIKNAWRVLHVVTVSLAEAGRYWAVEGEEVGRKAIGQIFEIPTIRALMDASEELRTALAMLDPESIEQMEEESENFKYWDGPDSPNEAPVLTLVTKPIASEDEE